MVDNYLKFVLGLILLWSADSFSFEIKWIVDGLNEPESAIYHKQSDAIFISNINGDPLKLDQNGYISKISVNGQILEKKWMKGFDAPKGLTVFQNFLFVSDVNKIWKIDINTKKKKYFRINNAGFLNDLAVTKDGVVFASDMFKNIIYKLEDDKLNIWKKSKLLNSPNGLLIEGNYIVVATWGEISTGFSTNVRGKLIKINLKTRQIKKFFSTRPIGNLDGIVFNKNNGYLVTDWIQGKLLSINRKGIVVKTKRINEGAADLEVVMHKNLVLIPMMKNNNLTAFEFN
ncbi:MAG: hypothetical protein ACJ0G4_00190 [Alphaproteobacteria bacterium]|tara:strand:+ start:1097 stop:1957 length:861 start_codon:yes stop_codon:yes gene_type:complete